MSCYKFTQYDFVPVCVGCEDNTSTINPFFFFFRKLQNVRPIIEKSHNLKYINYAITIFNKSDPSKHRIDFPNTKLIYS